MKEAAYYREQWLNDGLALLRKEVFVPNKFIPPKDINVSCGFPSTGALGSKKRRIGECWYPQKGTHHELFISPTLDKGETVLDVLSHEVCHTVAGQGTGHKAPFRRVAVKIGLEGKMTATYAGEDLKKLLASIGKRLGKYPHVAIDKMTTDRKKQGTRLIKASCAECEYTIRITRKWIEEVGLPTCPACGVDLTEPD
jgi:hypothetical protein